MCLMNSVFSKYLDKFVLVFLEDILVYSKNEEEHEDYLSMILQVLGEHQLYVNIKVVNFIKECYILWAILFGIIRNCNGIEKG